MRAGLAALLAAFALGAIASGASATTFVVNTTADHADDGCAPAPGGDCTLREAINAANAAAGTDVITLPSAASHYAISNAVGELPTISSSLDLNGGAAASTVIDAGGGSFIGHILQINDGGGASITVNVRDVTLEGVTNGGGGAGVFYGGTKVDALTLQRVVVRDNTNGPGVPAAGIAAASGIAGPTPSTFDVIDSTIAGNHGDTSDPGGGILVTANTNLTLDNSTIANNTTGNGQGAAIAVQPGLGGAQPSSVVIRNSTISGNSSAGGAVVSDSIGVVSFSYDTITGNTAGTGQAVLSRSSATGWTLKGTIITGNTGPNCSFTTNAASSGGFNFDSGTTCGFGLNPSDHPGTPLTLGPLQDNGGLTFTHALPAGSPAIDAGGLGGCSDVGSVPLTTDQRGVTRPNGAGCDSGAFEFVSPPPGGGGGGGTGGTGGGGGGGGGVDRTPPVLASASAQPAVFAVDPKGRAERLVTARLAHGTTLDYHLSEAARVLVTVQRATTGRKAGRRCVKATKRNRRARRCVRYTTVGRFAIASHAGANAHRFGGRIGRRSLAPGRYRLRLVARDAAGNRSRTRSISLRVVRGR